MASPRRLQGPSWKSFPPPVLLARVARRTGGSHTRKGTPEGARHVLEAKPGFEPGVRALQARALPLGHFAV